MQAPGRTGRPITEEYIDQYRIEADAWFDREVFIETFGMDKYMKEYGKLEKAGEWGTWEPCHKLMMGNGIVGIENLEEGSIRGDQILFDKAVSGFDVIVDGQLEVGTDRIIGAIGKAMAIRNQDKEEVKEDLMLGE